jgi:YidC/Oxa1 family membrane protein insertase
VFGAIIEAFNAFRNSLYFVLKFYQHLTEPLLGSQSYWFSIVLLTISVRVILIPLTVKQVKASRAMSELAPEIKKLQAKYKNDREKLSQEMMALYKERGANPASGCLPILAQAPFFLALYRVIFEPRIAGEANILRGHNFFGVPLERHWMQLAGADKFLSVDGIVILVLILGMAATTYISQRQLLARQAEVNPQQRMLIRVMPLLFAFFAVNFPLAVIIYWVTTNLWSMGQQYILLRNRPVVAAGAAGGGTKPGPTGGQKGGTSGGGKAARPGRSPKAAPSRDPRTGRVLDQQAKSGGERSLMERISDLFRPAAGDEGTGNPNGAASPSERRTGQQPSSNGKASGADAKPPAKPQGSGGSAQAKKTTAGRKPGSPPRSGGGKSSARGGQRRRKR